MYGRQPSKPHAVCSLPKRLPCRPPPAHRQVTPAVLAATACIVSGCVLLVSFGDHSSAVFTANDLLRLYAE